MINYSEMYPSFYENCLLVLAWSAYIHPWLESVVALAFHSVSLTTPSLDESSRST